MKRPKKMMKFLCNAILFSLLLCFLGTAQAQLDSLWKATKGEKIQQRVTAFNELAWEYKNISIDTSFYCANQALTLSKNTQIDSLLADSYNSLANAFEAAGQLDSAIFFHLKSLEINKRSSDSVRWADNLNNLGISHDKLGNNEESLSRYFEALSIYEAIRSDPFKIAMVLGNIGIVYKKLKQYDIVLEYYLKSLTIYEKQKSAFGIMVTKGNIGSLLLNLNSFEESLKYTEEALFMYDSAGYKVYLPYMYHNMAIAHDSLKQYNKALNYFNAAINGHQSNQNFYELANAWIGISHIYEKIGESNLAYTSAEKGYELAKKIAAQDLELKSILQLAYAATSQGNYKIANTWLVIHQRKSDSLEAVTNKEIIFELQTKYETEKKEQQILVQNAQLEQNFIEKQRNKLIIVVLLLVVLFVISAAFFWQNRLKHKQRAQLEKEKTLAREKEIQAVIASQEKERNRFSRDLHDTFGQLLSTLNLYVQSARQDLHDKDKRDLNFNQASQIIHDMYDELKNVCFDLMPQSLIKGGIRPAIEEFSRRINKNNKLTLSTHFFGFDQRTLTDVQEINLYRIIQEWVNNILKYSDARQITIQLTKDEVELNLLIEDDGQGYDVEILKSGKGNGWRNISSRAQLLNGQVYLDIVPNRRGNTFTISLPFQYITNSSSINIPS